mmetsp:Transcript_84544/g.176881  ORF Transcript_84544/g.176881 Transcript_84544/m.176881 type:complete len:81 (-) Transcript_84544:262-504(-)
MRPSGPWRTLLLVLWESTFHQFSLFGLGRAVLVSEPGFTPIFVAWMSFSHQSKHEMAELAVSKVSGVPCLLSICRSGAFH